MFSTKPCGVCDTSSASFNIRMSRGAWHSLFLIENGADALDFLLSRVPCILSDFFVVIRLNDFLQNGGGLCIFLRMYIGIKARYGL